MGARQKLNGSYFLGSLLSAGAVGCLMDSWVILVISLVILISHPKPLQRGDTAAQAS